MLGSHGNDAAPKRFGRRARRMAGTLAACTRATKRAKSFFLAPLYDRVGCPNSVCVKLLAVYTAGIC